MTATVQEHTASLIAAFCRLSASRKSVLARQAREYIAQHPGCADHSTFWRGLSARHVLAAASK